MPDDVFKKVPKFGKLKFGTAKVHWCPKMLRITSLENRILHKSMIDGSFSSGWSFQKVVKFGLT